MTCERCGTKVGPDARCSDGRWICTPCLRVTSTWPTGKGKLGNLYYQPPPAV